MTTEVIASPYRLLNVPDAARFMSECTGQPVTERQMRRWSTRDRRGHRPLPFAECRLTGRLLISETALLDAVLEPQKKAAEEWRKRKK
jgi:hypothetical protein